MSCELCSFRWLYNVESQHVLVKVRCFVHLKCEHVYGVAGCGVAVMLSGVQSDMRRKLLYDLCKEEGTRELVIRLSVCVSVTAAWK